MSGDITQALTPGMDTPFVATGAGAFLGQIQDLENEQARIERQLLEERATNLLARESLASKELTYRTLNREHLLCELEIMELREKHSQLTLEAGSVEKGTSCAARHVRQLQLPQICVLLIPIALCPYRSARTRSVHTEYGPESGGDQCHEQQGGPQDRIAFVARSELPQAPQPCEYLGTCDARPRESQGRPVQVALGEYVHISRRGLNTLAEILGPNLRRRSAQKWALSVIDLPFSVSKSLTLMCCMCFSDQKMRAAASRLDLRLLEEVRENETEKAALLDEIALSKARLSALQSSFSQTATAESQRISQLKTAIEVQRATNAAVETEIQISEQKIFAGASGFSVSDWPEL